MEPVSMIVAIAIAVGGLLSGTRIERRRSRRLIAEAQAQAQAQAAKAMCACDHAFGVHVDGECQGKIRQETGRVWDRNALEWNISYKWVQCPCRTYSGPPPLTIDIWAPRPILPVLEDL